MDPWVRASWITGNVGVQRLWDHLWAFVKAWYEASKPSGGKTPPERQSLSDKDARLVPAIQRGSQSFASRGVQPDDPSALPTTTRGSEPRTSLRSSGHRRTHEKKPVDVPGFGEEVRKRRTIVRATTAHARSSFASRELPKRYWRNPLRYLAAYFNRHNRRQVVLEIFSGSSLVYGLPHGCKKPR